jgi:hypothetical protein
MEDYAIQNTSNINGLALAFLMVVSAIVVSSSRQNAAKTLLVTAAFVPLGQEVVVFGLHFTFLRILILIALCRVFARNEVAGFKLIAIDKLVIFWSLLCMVCGVLRGPKPETFGWVYNELGTYFLFRVLVRTPKDVVSHLRLLAYVAIIVALCMSWEFTTHRNLFHVFGGVPEFVGERNGAFRCQGAFRNCILAGMFAATLLPLMLGLWFHERSQRTLALLAMAGCAFSAWAAASSGAMLTMLTAIIGFLLWPMRHRMSVFRWGLVAIFVGFALCMKAPPWYLIAKISDVMGGTGWHRSYLIDQFLGHFTQWCLIGTSYTANWAPAGQVLAVDPNNMDITNHYVAQGIRGGLLGLGLFIGSIVVCFKVVGREVRHPSGLKLDEKLLWAVGVSLACNCVAFISISYYDQVIVFWFWTLAMIAALDGMRTQQLKSSSATSKGLRRANLRHTSPVPAGERILTLRIDGHAGLAAG